MIADKYDSQAERDTFKQLTRTKHNFLAHVTFKQNCKDLKWGVCKMKKKPPNKRYKLQSLIPLQESHVQEMQRFVMSSLPKCTKCTSTNSPQHFDAISVFANAVGTEAVNRLLTPFLCLTRRTMKQVRQVQIQCGLKQPLLYAKCSSLLGC